MPTINLKGAGEGKGGKGGSGGKQSAVARAWQNLIENPSVSSAADFRIAWQNSPVADQIFHMGRASSSPGSKDKFAAAIKALRSVPTSSGPQGIPRLTYQPMTPRLNAMHKVYAGQVGTFGRGTITIDQNGVAYPHKGGLPARIPGTGFTMVGGGRGGGANFYSGAGGTYPERGGVPALYNQSRALVPTKRIETALVKIERATESSARTDKVIAGKVAGGGGGAGRYSGGGGYSGNYDKPDYSASYDIPGTLAGQRAAARKAGVRSPRGGKGAAKGIYAWHYKGLGHAAVAGLVGGASADLIMEAISAARDVLNPAEIAANVANAFGNKAAPQMDLRIAASRYGRAGGFSRGALANRLFPGGGVTPHMMSILGISSPAEAMKILESSGISPRSTSQAMSIVGGMRIGALSPALSTLHSGQFASMANSAMSMGLIKPNQGGIEGYALQLSRVLTPAIAKGFNASRIAQSIDQNIRTLGGYGAGVSTRGLMNFSGRMQSSGLPSAATGQLAVSAAQSNAATWRSVGTSPVSTLIAGQYAQSHRTRASLIKSMGMPMYRKIMASPAGRLQMSNYLAAMKAGKPILALPYLSTWSQANPQFGAHVMSSGAQRMMGVGPNSPDYMKTAAGAVAFGGLYAPGAVGASSGYQSGSAPGGPSSTMTGFIGRANSEAGLRSYVFSPAKVKSGHYYRELLRLGFSAKEAHSLIATGAKTGIDPVAYGKLVTRAEDSNPQAWAANSGSTASGPAQTTIGAKTAAALHGGPSIGAQSSSKSANLSGGLVYFARRIKEYHKATGIMPTGTIAGALYKGGAGGWVSQINSTDARALANYGATMQSAGGLGLPKNVYRDTARQGQNNQEAAYTAFVEFTPAVTTATAAIGGMTSAANKFISTVNARGTQGAALSVPAQRGN